MMFSATLALFAASAASLVSAATHNVVVGDAGGLTFSPNQITAEVNDLVVFEYKAKNHTVTQSAFATPCALLVNETTNQVGFDSGFVPVANGSTSFPTWTIQVTAATPIWFYCRQANHCQQGMVGAINAPTNGTKTFQAFQALAMSSNSTTTTNGGTGTTVSAGSGVGASASGSVSGESPAATGSSGSSSSSSPASPSGGGSNAGANLKVAHAGLVVGASAALAFALF